MIEIERIALGWFRGPKIDFRDDGPVKKGAKTRKYTPFNRHNRQMLGYIRWQTNFIAYVFFPLANMIDSASLHEIAKFCEEATKAQRDRALPVALERAAREKEKKRREKYLTGPRQRGIIALQVKEVARQIEPVPDRKHQVVEGCEAPNVIET
jgi:flagellar motility protein MotE (MotC chaperone)